MLFYKNLMVVSKEVIKDYSYKGIKGLDVLVAYTELCLSLPVTITEV